MPLNILLLTSLIDGTSVTQSGVTVNVKRLTGEKILFFRLDDQSIKSILELTGSICDYLVSYQKEEQKPVLCLLELKGKGVKHAIEQLNNTHVCLISRFKERSYWKSIRDVTWKGYVCCNQHSPLEPTKPYVAQLQAIFGSSKNYDITRNPNIGAFLRQ